MVNEVDILATRFNYEAEVMFGCSQQEVMRAVIWIMLPIALLCGIALMPLLGNFMYGIALGIIVGMGGFFASLLLLRKLRKDQEIGFLTQKMQTQFAKHGLAYLDIIHRSGTWMIGRML